jgi:dihydroorotate dehydrogenase (NAD+) catalytic subunit
MISLSGGAEVDLGTRVGDVELANPVLAASGTAGHGAELGAYFDLRRLGGLVVKSLMADPWPGNASPRVVPVRAGMLNSVGLQGPGVAAWIEDELPALERAGARVVASIWGRHVEDFARAAHALKGVADCVVAVEVNVSCPNLDDRDKMFAHSPSATAEAVDAAEPCGLPRWVKLSPNTADLIEIAGAAVAAGGSALVLTNTALGLALDLETRRPALGGIGGGLSGPALHAIAVRAVYECRRAFPTSPIVGVGGICDGEDAVEFLLAGASAIEVGTATFADPRAVMRVLEGIVGWCRRHEVAATRDLVGAAHE